MSFEPLSDRFLHHLEHPLAPTTPAHSTGSLASSPAGLFLSDVPDTPLTWLWPGRIPLGHLTLLDAAPGSDPSLLALTLAACVSSGKPLPDGTPTRSGCVILSTPYDSASTTLKPRLQAAGGDPSHVLLLRPPLESTSQTSPHVRALALPGDLEHLATLIRCLEAQLVILDPASAIPGLFRCLPALIDLAQQTNCAILLIRSLHQSPADLLRSSGPTSPLQEAARSRLLLLPDPADERHHLLITTSHLLCAQPPILAYDLLLSDADLFTIHWLAAPDHTHLARLSTGPLHSPHRQAILRFLQNSASPQSIPAILAATCYDPEAGRKMLTRMKLAGELVSPARGLYTTSNHPSLASLPNDPHLSKMSQPPWTHHRPPSWMSPPLHRHRIRHRTLRRRTILHLP
jgi:AAA domain